QRRLEAWAQDVVDADEERLGRQRHGTAGCTLPAEVAGVVIDGLRREETQLEVHDLLPRGVAQGIDGGGMAECGAVGLIAQIEMNRLAGERLAPIPHYRRQEAEVGRRQRTTEERQLVRRCV